MNETDLKSRAARVLIVSGGLLTEKESSLLQALRKQRMQSRFAQNAWLDIKIKLMTAEPLLSMMLKRKLSPGVRRLARRHGRELLNSSSNVETPELTEVVLATLLQAESMTYQRASVADLFVDSERFERLLATSECVFLSATLLRDMSELEPLVQRLKRPHNRIVIGGALAGLICQDWRGMPGVDLLAVGYGEILVPALVAWIHSGYRQLQAPPGGRLVELEQGCILHSGTPAGKSLDALPRPDWALGFRDHGRSFPMVYYESVRGCPYRCGFCNYPYLFDDTRFRYRSAQKMADDWAYYVQDLGVEYITCLDSLFTMPKKRLKEFCRLLIERNIRVKWICYARADDLADETTVELMKAAGVHQVQIGIESGDQVMLDNMNKACSVEANGKALQNCRKHGITSIVSVIVGYPGETAASLENTFRFLRDYPPDFYYLAVFSTRAAGVPVLRAEQRQKFGLVTADNAYAMAPYWSHASMNCLQAAGHVRRLNQRIMRESIALNAVLFYSGMLDYQPRHRQGLLELQARCSGQTLLTRVFDLAHRWIDRRLQRDIALEIKPDPLWHEKPARSS